MRLWFSHSFVINSSRARFEAFQALSVSVVIKQIAKNVHILRLLAFFSRSL